MTREEIIDELAEGVFEDAMGSMPSRMNTAYKRWQWMLAHKDGITSGWGGACYDRAAMSNQIPDGDGDYAHDDWGVVGERVMDMYHDAVRKLKLEALAELG